MEKNCVYSFIL